MPIKIDVTPDSILGARAVVKRGSSWTLDLPKKLSEICKFEEAGNYNFIFIHVGNEVLLLIPMKVIVNPKTIYNTLKSYGLADFLSPVDVEKMLKELAEE